MMEGLHTNVPPIPQQWHAMSVEKAMQALSSSLEGLSPDEVLERRRVSGSNVIVPVARRSAMWTLLSQFQSPLVIILFVAAGLSFFFHAIPDGWIVVFIILFNGVVGFFQEQRAGHAMERLQSLTPHTVRVIRSGEERELPSDQLVIGDVVMLEVGSIVPADGRLVESFNLKTDEAVFTGESVAALKHAKPLDEITELSERRNIAWRGTTVVGGRGLLLVTNVGSKTRFGEIVREVSEIGNESTPFQKSIAEFARKLAIVIVVLSCGIFLLGVFRGISVEQSLMLSISLVVSLIPEGLPLVITLTFAWGMWQMAKRRALIRKLYAVETLGSVTVIVSDKTGTLTFGEMMVERVVTGHRDIQVTGEGYRKSGDFFEHDAQISLIDDVVLHKLVEVGVLNNDSRLSRDEKGAERWIGDPTEISLIVLGEKAGIKHTDLDLAYPRVGEFPFDFSLKYMVTFHSTSHGTTLVAVKGAPRQILSLCSKKLTPDGVVAFVDRDRAEVRGSFEQMAERSLRGLAFAYAEVEGPWQLVTHQNLSAQLVYLGLVGIRDTVRTEAASTVMAARDAGVRVVMLTGDYHVTAANVAREVGILRGDEQGQVVDGKDLDTMTDDDLMAKLPHIAVFSRVSPEQKLRIARLLKKSGEIIAMTGDGINDVPALTEANIGVAIANTSTDAAKEAAEMLVTDGNLSSIVAAIEEGRVIFKNIQRVLVYLLASNFGELVLITITMFLGLPLPLLPIHIMWLNVITDPFLGIALAREPKGPEIMHEPPRVPHTPVLNNQAWRRIGLNGMAIGLATYVVFKIVSGQHRPDHEVYAVTLTTIALCEWVVAFPSRSSHRSTFSRLTSNKLLLPVMALVVAMQLAIIYVPPLANAFHIARLTINDWLVAAAAALFVVLVEEVRKAVSRRHIHIKVTA